MKFIYSIDKSVSIYNFYTLIIKLLEKNKKWEYKKFNQDNIYHLVNSIHNNIYSNKSIINNYIGNSIVTITFKYNFHLYLKEYENIFIPKTYLIYNNINNIINNNPNLFNNLLILKDSILEFSKGIKLIQNKDELITHIKPNNKYILQHIIPNPKLISGKKFDIRMYIILVYEQTKINIYLFYNGYIRISSINYNINKLIQYDSIIINHDKNRLYRSLKKSKLYDIILKQSIKIIKKSFKKLLPHIQIANHLQGFHILGLDFILDSTNKLWFIEANHGPTLDCPNILKNSNDLLNTLIKEIIEPLILHNKIIPNNKLIKII